MRIIHPFLWCQKYLCGIVLTIIALFAFHPGVSSSALSPEPAQETGSTMVVTLSAESTAFLANGNVTVDVTITNSSDHPVSLLKWNTPLEGFGQPLFTVLRDGKPAGYLGRLVKRPAPTDEDYLTLAAGESLIFRVDLTEQYDFSVTGEYVLTYDTDLLERFQTGSDTSLAISAGDAVSNSLALTIEGRAAPLPNELQALTVSGSNTFNGCSASQQTDLINARNSASTYASNAVAYFGANRQGDRYTTWFGSYDSNRYSIVATHFNVIHGALANASPMQFDCTCTDPYYAYVYPNQPYNVYLCSAFWSAPATGTDSKAGTLVHEISHFTVVADTDDHVYGQTASKNLAISNPALAITNADSHEYFAENTPPLENDVLPTTTHCGSINSNETWSSSGNVHVITCNVTVSSGVTLTIGQGAIVKFQQGTSLIVQGSLRVLGAGANPVYLTSIKDDTVGGDTNNDGASLPGAGNWSRIEFQDSSNDANSLIDHAVIRYGGGCCYYGGITLVSASPTIQNTTLSNNQNYAIRANVTSFPTLANNTYTSNGVNGLAVQGGTISSNATWDMTDTAYFLIDNVSVGFGATLTVNPGVVVKFQDGRALFVQGSLRALGTSGSQIYFTSKRDDTVKGDTNNDGASLPGAGNWSRIEFQDSSNDANSLIDHAVIRYGGGCCYYGGITLVSASPTIQNTTLSNNQNYGIYTSNSTPILSCNDIYSNNSYGFYNSTPGVLVDAENQWWGSASGPNHATLNSGGVGNKVGNGIDFIPFRTSPCNSSSPTQTFADVPVTHMFWRYIEAFYDAGITTGCSTNPMKFCPLANVTRGEMAVFLERAMGNFSPTPNPSGMFTDVPYPGQPASFQAFIEEFYNDGITTGCSTNPLKYCPQNYVTRGEMAVFIERALGNFAPTPSQTGMFADVPNPNQPPSFQAFIEQFYLDGITTGCANNPLRYCPLNKVTRQEMAVFIVRAFGIPLP